MQRGPSPLDPGGHIVVPGGGVVKVVDVVEVEVVVVGLRILMRIVVVVVVVGGFTAGTIMGGVVIGGIIIVGISINSPVGGQGQHSHIFQPMPLSSGSRSLVKNLSGLSAFCGFIAGSLTHIKTSIAGLSIGFAFTKSSLITSKAYRPACLAALFYQNSSQHFLNFLLAFRPGSALARG